jgi:hypothetical protein
MHLVEFYRAHVINTRVTDDWPIVYVLTWDKSAEEQYAVAFSTQAQMDTAEEFYRQCGVTGIVRHTLHVMPKEKKRMSLIREVRNTDGGTELTVRGLTFAAWKAVVERHLERLAGVDSDGIDDYDYYRAWSTGWRAERAAQAALEAAGFHDTHGDEAEEGGDDAD